MSLFCLCHSGTSLLEGNDGFANGDFLAFLILGPALNSHMRASIVTGATFVNDAMAGEGIIESYHVQKAYLEASKFCFGSVSQVLGNKLSKKGHTEHAMGDNAIQANAMCSFFIKMNGIVVTGCFCIATQLLLCNGRLDQWGKGFTRCCLQNAHKLACLPYKTGCIERQRLGVASITAGCQPGSPYKIDPFHFGFLQ